MIAPVPFSKFVLGWLPAATVALAADPAPRLADVGLLAIGALQVPPVTCVLGLLGVLMARPLVRRQEGALSLPLFLLVTIIMVITVQLWILDSRPGALFAFVVAIGAGFSGYSLIEAVGDQLRSIVRNLMSRKAGTPAAEPRSNEE